MNINCYKINQIFYRNIFHMFGLERYRTFL